VKKPITPELFQLYVKTCGTCTCNTATSNKITELMSLFESYGGDENMTNGKDMFEFVRDNLAYHIFKKDKSKAESAMRTYYIDANEEKKFHGLDKYTENMWHELREKRLSAVVERKSSPKKGQKSITAAKSKPEKRKSKHEQENEKKKAQYRAAMNVGMEYSWCKYGDNCQDNRGRPTRKGVKGNPLFSSPNDTPHNTHIEEAECNACGLLESQNE